MRTLSLPNGRLVVTLTAALALFGMACSGAGDDRPAYSSNDDSFVLDAAPQATGCQSGQVKSCTIWLGQHGDLNNCVYGMDVCMDDGSWSGCVDEDTMAENPDLYASLAPTQG